MDGILRFPTYPTYQAGKLFLRCRTMTCQRKDTVLQDFSVFQNFDKDKILDEISSGLVFAKACVSEDALDSVHILVVLLLFLDSSSCCSSYLLVLLVAVCEGAACKEHTPCPLIERTAKAAKSLSIYILLHLRHPL